jgi:L-alanine-DL-glutamate epimerase-like enolase superfamily enzyme
MAVSVYRVPTDFPESDGTIDWDSTTMVLVEVTAGNETGLGYTYSDAAAAEIIRKVLARCVIGHDGMDIPGNWQRMVIAIRNQGRPGICASAISAVDNALWDLKAKLLNLPLAKLLGVAQQAVPVYGSGGFVSYSIKQLQQQLAGWVNEGIPRVKMKIGRDAKADVARVRAARQAIGRDAELFVDANGAYQNKQAVTQAERFAEFGVNWFEEPVSSDDLDGLRFIRERAPRDMEIAAGEYGYDSFYFRRMLEAQAVDVIQIDATRCCGITGFLQGAALASAFHIPVSAHTAPSLHAHPCCALANVRHVEFFHDHARIEWMFFDGAANPIRGALVPDWSRPGFGLEFKRGDAEVYLVDGGA